MHDVNYHHLDQLTQEVESFGCNLSKLHSIKNLKRKVEWLSIRKLLQIPFDQAVDIVYNQQHKPFIKGAPLSLSISHSFERVGIYLKDSEPIGLDIQKVTDKIQRIKHKFLNNEEQDNLNIRETETLTIYWSLKEAAFKAYGINNIYLKDNIHILKYEAEGGIAVCKVQKDFYNEIFHLRFQLKDNYALAYVVNS